MSLYPDYADTAELQHYLRIPDGGEDEEDNVELGLALTASSRAIDLATNRQFGLAASATARIETPHWNEDARGFEVYTFDLMTTTGLVIKSDIDGDGVFETTITDYTLLPRNAAADGKPWTKIRFGSDALLAEVADSLEITAKWGWSAVPSAIKSACLLQASRIVKRRDAPFGIAGSPEMGSQMRLLARLDPDVSVLVAPYRRWTWSVV